MEGQPLRLIMSDDCSAWSYSGLGMRLFYRTRCTLWCKQCSLVTLTKDDNGSIHTSTQFQEWFLRHQDEVKCLHDVSIKSSDLNITELLWEAQQRSVSNRFPPFLCHKKLNTKKFFFLQMTTVHGWKLFWRFVDLQMQPSKKDNSGHQFCLAESHLTALQCKHICAQVNVKY